MDIRGSMGIRGSIGIKGSMGAGVIKIIEGLRVMEIWGIRGIVVIRVGRGIRGFIIIRIITHALCHPRRYEEGTLLRLFT